jgi:hypothetical protein
VDLNISRADIRTSEPQVKDSEALSSSEPLISKLKVQGKSQSKMTQGIALKISGPMLMRGVKTSEAPLGSKTLIYSRSKSWNQSKPKSSFKGYDNFRPSDKPKKQKKSENLRTNKKGPIRMCVPKSEIIFATDLHTKKQKAAVMVLGQWLLTTYDGRKAYVPNPNSERGRLCGVWRKAKREDHWYRYSW